MKKIKKFFNEASVEFYMVLTLFCFGLLFLVTWMYFNVNKEMYYYLIGVIAVLFVIITRFGLEKSAENVIAKYQKTSLKEIKKWLPDEYVPIYLFSSSKMDRKYVYYGKINEDNTLLVYGVNNGIKKEFNEFNSDYMWFMKNFYKI